MALFGRDYDREFGHRGRSFGGNWNEHHDRDWGDRMRAGWNQMKENVRDTFGGYDQEYGHRGHAGGWSGGMGRHTGQHMGHNMSRGLEDDRGTGRGMWGGGTYDREYGRQGFDSDVGNRQSGGMFGTGAGYNRSTWNAGNWRAENNDRNMMRGGMGSMDYNREYHGSMGYDRGNYMSGDPREGNWVHDSRPRNTTRDTAFYRGWY